MKPNKGLSRNYKTIDQPSGMLVYGKNGAHDNTGASQNERGFSVCSAQIPYTVHGVIETDSDPVFFSTDDTYSAFGFYNEQTDTYVPIYNDVDKAIKLGFKRSHPITGEFRRNFKNEIELAWLDGISAPRFANTSQIGTDLQDFTLFPEYSTPNIKLESTEGGSLEVGTYFVALRYSNGDGTHTRYSSVSSPVSLRSENYLSPGFTSGKGIRVSLSGLDQSYDKFSLAIVKRINGITTAMEMDSTSITADTAVVNILSHTGNDITLEEVLIPPAFYIQAGSITQLNDILYLADVEEAATLNLQAIANHIEVEVECKVRKVDVFQPVDNDIKDGSFRTFKHGEVYALYFVGILKSGLKTQAFHVPGRDGAGTMDEMWLQSKFFNRFQIEDTTGATQFIDPLTRRMSPGIWVNLQEYYPVHPDYAMSGITGNVRHHKMPSSIQTKNMFKDSMPAGYKYGVNCMDFLGLRFNNVVIPEALQGELVGYEIHYAKRTYENSLIAGQGCLTFPAKLFKNGTIPGWPGTPEQTQALLNEIPASKVLWTTGGNFASTVNADKFGGGAAMTLDLVLDKFVRIHSPDLIVNRPGISPNVLKLNYSLRAKIIQLHNNTDGISFMADYTGDNGSYAAATTTSGFNKQIGTSSHIPNMGVVGDMNNLKGEPAFITKIEGAAIPLQYQQLNRWISGSGSSELLSFEETHIVDILTVKDNLYSPFYSQDLVRIGHIDKPLEEAAFHYGGDCFICIDSYYSHGIFDGIETGQVNIQAINWDEEESHKDKMDPTDGTKVLRVYIVESSLNLWQRYKDPGLPTSAFYPQTNSPEYMKTMDRTVDNNIYGYDKSSSSTADLTQGLKPYNTEDVNITKSPFRIVRSQPQSREGKKNNWKQFSALDYFETQKDMGPIVNLQGYDERLIIHHRNALFITQDKTTLKGDILDVTLGTGDIFRFPPKQGRPSKLGYAGTQHKLAAVLTSAGYLFPDAETGELFILGEKGLDEISGELSNFFSKHFRTPETNVFQGNGITLGYDDVYKRVLVTCKQAETSFTLSYDTKERTWAYFHDYFPDYYVHTRKHTYALKDSKLYQVSTGERGLYFKRDVHAPFFMDVVFNAKQVMVLNNVNWKTEVALEENDDTSQVTLWDETLSAITIWNNYQCTGRIPLDKLNKNNRNTEQTWNFNDFRNLAPHDGTAFLENLFKDFKVKDTALLKNLPWFKKGLMEGDFFVVRFEYANNNNKQITVHEVDLSVSSLKANT